MQPILPAIHTAIINRQSYEIIQSLLDQGTDPNAPDYRDNTPLHRAVERNRADVVELLLHYKANVNIQNCYGHTPLHCAIYSNTHSPIIRNLLHSGASPHIQNREGVSSLELAHDACDINLVALIHDCLDAD